MGTGSQIAFPSRNTSVKETHFAKLQCVIYLSAVPTKNQHIMISYQWDCQDTIIQVKEKLRSVGFNVWIDVEEMTGSTLETMASAVEHCTFFLMAISRKYFESPNCRAGKPSEAIHTSW